MVSLPTPHANPLFNYISYCKILDYNKILSCVRTKLLNNFHTFVRDWNDVNLKWNKHCFRIPFRSIESDRASQIELIKPFEIIISREIHKLLFNNYSIIKTLDINFAQEINFFQIYLHVNIHDAFKKLTVLYCETRNDSSLFYILASYCHLLRSIHIRKCQSDNPGLANLIDVQHNLTSIECMIDNNDAIFMNQQVLVEIGNALIKKVNTITHLKVSYQLRFFLPLKLLADTKNLKVLELTNRINYPDRRLDILSSKKFSQLEVLTMGKVNIQLVIQLIENTEGKLSEVVLDTTYHERYSGHYIQTVCRYCPNIKVLSLGINTNDFDNFDNLLINCQKLQKIIIDRYQKPNLKDTKKLYDILLKSSPKILCEIRIASNWVFLASDLDKFIVDWNARIPPVPLTMYLSIFIKSDETFNVSMKMLEQHEKDGTLKHYDFFCDNYIC
ncbi:5947_t:CDS:1 [Funneliformis mosseae]|uniref:5947_t:CDS:1 n=1 Tax=Funneliformis mosseae TaxID=27381 RepID=A0A9N8V6K1_FUNMO|nr:5947_t:CDS:1 [Funneliformis mosseae]